jgi:hypothetical protein
MLVTAAFSAAAQVTSSVTLAWDPNPSPEVAGYRLYEGLVSGVYTTVIDVGDSTSVTASNLICGATYYFAVTDYDNNGLESPFSSEISYTVPPTPVPVTMQLLNSPQPQQMQISATAPAGYLYNVEATSDLANWDVIGSALADANGLLQYMDPAATNAMRFYRLVQVSP